MKMLKNKTIKEVMIGLFLLVLITVMVTASPLSYVNEPVVPEKENLELSGNAEVDLFSGAVTYSYSINVPKGTNELRPNIELRYNSNGKRKGEEVLGNGWSLSESYIRRNINSSAPDISDDEFTLILEGNSYDLVYTGNQEFHTKVGDFFKVNNYSGGVGNSYDEYWVVRTKDGKVYRFGYYNFSEISANLYDYVWQWNLDLVNDTYGNQIFYNYSENPHSEDNGTYYLDQISYNNDKKRTVNFLYESSARPDKLTIFDNGNKILRSRRLKEISTWADNILIKRYYLDYNTFIGNESLTTLSNITLFGSNNLTSIPIQMFSYRSPEIGWSGEITWAPPTNKSCYVTNAGDDLGIRLADVNGDGLVDFLKGKQGSGSTCNNGTDKNVYLNNNTGWIEDQSWLPNLDLCFVDLGGGDRGFRLADVNGDGLADVLWGRATSENPEDCGDNQKLAYINNGTSWVEDDSWEPLFCFVGGGTDLGIRLADVNGDGLVDFIFGRGGAGCDIHDRKTFINNGTYWVEDTTWDLPDNSCFVQGDRLDRGVRFGDINGDGLADVSRGRRDTGDCKTDTERMTYINNGTGWVAEPSLVVPNGTCFMESGGTDRGLRLIDINGDGLDDLIWSKSASEDPLNCGDAQRHAWINNGTSWYYDDQWEPQFCFVTQSGVDAGIRLLDMNGDGIVDLSKGRADGAEDCHAVENNATLSESVAPYLLENISTEFGGVIKISYLKSTTLDNKGEDNLSDLGFNTWVVSNITYDNGMVGTSFLVYTNYYNYSSGMYDYSSKELRDLALKTHRLSAEDWRKTELVLTTGKLARARKSLLKKASELLTPVSQPGFFEV